MNRFFSTLVQSLTIILCVLGSAKAEPLLGAPCAIEIEKKQLGGGSIEYIKAGRGMPVILLHGLFAQKEQWSDVACELSFAGFMAIAPDLPGYGNSKPFPIGDYRLERQVALLHRFIESLGFRKIHIAGSSMGGAIASMYGNQYPRQTRSLAFIGAPLGVGPWGVRVQEALLRGVNPFIPINAEQLNLEMELLFYEPPVVPESIRDELLANYQKSNRHYQQVWNIVNLYTNQISKLPPRAIPTLILWGREDSIFSVEDIGNLQLKYPANQHYILPQAGHLLMLEKPKEVSGRYIDFLKH